jgi:hypothetical protein
VIVLGTDQRVRGASGVTFYTIEHICSKCGRTRRIERNRAKKLDRTHGSCKDCLQKSAEMRALRRKISTENPKNYKIKCIIPCLYCGNLQRRTKRHLELYKMTFCGPKCQVRWQNKNTDFNKGTKNPAYIVDREGLKIHNKLKRLLRTRVSDALLGKKDKGGSAVRDLGCSIEELKAYIESKFMPGMTWENRGKKGWHIDHIIPLSAFNLSNEEQFRAACHYTNLQPLWAIDNIRKGPRF